MIAGPGASSIGVADGPPHLAKTQYADAKGPAVMPTERGRATSVDASVAATGVASRVAAVVLAGVSPGHHSIVPAVAAAGRSLDHSAGGRGPHPPTSVAASIADVASAAAAAACATAGSAAASGVGGGRPSEDAGAGGAFHAGGQDSPPIRWADAWLTLLPDCALLWAYVSPKQDAASRASIAGARSGGQQQPNEGAASAAPKSLRDQLTSALHASKGEGAVGMRLVARIPLSEECAAHSAGPREWQIYSVPEVSGAGAKQSADTPQPSIVTLRSATASEMLWWLSLLPTRRIAASDNSLLAVADASVAGDALLQSTRDSIRVLRLGSLWASLHTHELRQRLWSALAHFPGADHLLLAWLHIRGYELAHPLTRRLAPSLASGSPASATSTSWPNALASCRGDAEGSYNPPPRGLLKVADFHDLLTDEDIACVAAHAHATFGRFFCVPGLPAEASEPPSVPLRPGKGVAATKRPSTSAGAGVPLSAAPGSRATSAARTPYDSARAVLECVPAAIVADVADAVGWYALNPRRGAELNAFPAPDAFAPARIAIEVAIYARILIPYAGALLNPFCESGSEVLGGAGVVSEFAAAPAPAPHRGRQSGVAAAKRSSFWGGGGSSEDDPFGVEAMRRAQHGRTASAWVKQQRGASAEARVRNFSAAPSSVNRVQARPAAAVTAPAPASRWGSASVASASAAKGSALAPALRPPLAALAPGKKAQPPPASPHVGAAGSPSLPDLPLISTPAVSSGEQPSLAPFAMSSAALGARSGFGLTSAVVAPGPVDPPSKSKRPNHSAGPGGRSLPLHSVTSGSRVFAPQSLYAGAFDNGGGSFSGESSKASRLSVASLVAFDLEAALQDGSSFDGRESAAPALTEWTADAAARLLLPVFPPRTALGGLTGDADPLGGGAPYSSTAAKMLGLRWAAATASTMLSATAPVVGRADASAVPVDPVVRQASFSGRSALSATNSSISAPVESRTPLDVGATALAEAVGRVLRPAGAVAALVEKFSSQPLRHPATVRTSSSTSVSGTDSGRASDAPVLPDRSDVGSRSSVVDKAAGTVAARRGSDRPGMVRSAIVTGRSSDTRAPLQPHVFSSFSLPDAAAAPVSDTFALRALCAVDWTARPIGVHLPLDTSLLHLPAPAWIDRWRQKWDHHRGLRRKFSSSAAFLSGGSQELDAERAGGVFRLSGAPERQPASQPLIPTCSVTPHELSASGTGGEAGGVDVNTKVLVLFMHRLRVPSHEVAPFNSAMLLSTLPAHVLAQLPNTPDGSAIMSPVRVPRRVGRDAASRRTDRGSSSFASESAVGAAPTVDPILSSSDVSRGADLGSIGLSQHASAVRIRAAQPGSWTSIWLRDTSAFGRRRSSDASSNAGAEGLLLPPDVPVSERPKSRQSVVMSAATVGLMNPTSFSRERIDSAVLSARSTEAPAAHYSIGGLSGMAPIMEESDYLRELEVTYAIQDAAAHALLVTAELEANNAVDRLAVAATRDELRLESCRSSVDLAPPAAAGLRTAPAPPPRVAVPAPPPRPVPTTDAGSVSPGVSLSIIAATSRSVDSGKSACARCTKSSKFRDAFGFDPLPGLPTWVAHARGTADGLCRCPRQGKRLSPRQRSFNLEGIRTCFSRSVSRWADVTLRDLNLDTSDANALSIAPSSSPPLSGMVIALPSARALPTLSQQGTPTSSNDSASDGRFNALGPLAVIPATLRPPGIRLDTIESPDPAGRDVVAELLCGLGLRRRAEAVHWSRRLTSSSRLLRAAFVVRSSLGRPPPSSREARVSAMSRRSRGASPARSSLNQRGRGPTSGVSSLSSLPELPSALLWQGNVRLSWCHALAGHPALLSLDAVTSLESPSQPALPGEPVRQLLRALVAASLPPGVAGGQRRIILSAHSAMTQACAEWVSARSSPSATGTRLASAPATAPANTGRVRPAAPPGSVKFDVDYDAAFTDLVTALLWPSVQSRARNDPPSTVESAPTTEPVSFFDTAFAQIYSDGTLRFFCRPSEGGCNRGCDSTERWAAGAARLLFPAVCATLESSGYADTVAKPSWEADPPPTLAYLGGLWLPACLDVAPCRDVAAPGHASELVLRAGYLTLVPCDPRAARTLLGALQVASTQPAQSIAIAGAAKAASHDEPQVLEPTLSLFEGLVKALTAHGLVANFSASQASGTAAAAAATALPPSACRTAAAANALTVSGPSAIVTPDRITPLAIVAALSPSSEASAAGHSAAAAAETMSSALSLGLSAGIVRDTSMVIATAGLQKRGRINRGFKPRTVQALFAYRLPPVTVYCASALSQLLALQRRVITAQLARRELSEKSEHADPPSTPRVTPEDVRGIGPADARRSSIFGSKGGGEDGASPRIEPSHGDSKTPATPSSAVVAGASPALPALNQPRRSFFVRGPRSTTAAARPRREDSGSSFRSPLSMPPSKLSMRPVASDTIDTPPLNPLAARAMHAWATVVTSGFPLGYADVFVIPAVASMLASDAALPSPLMSLILSDPGDYTGPGASQAPGGISVALMSGESLPMCSRYLLRVRSRNLLRLVALPVVTAVGVGSSGGLSAGDGTTERLPSVSDRSLELLSPLRLLRAIRASDGLSAELLASDRTAGTASIRSDVAVSSILSRSPAAALLFSAACLVDSSGCAVSLAYFKHKKASGARVPRGIIALLAEGQCNVQNVTVRLPTAISRAVVAVAPGLTTSLLRLQRSQASPPASGLPSIDVVSPDDAVDAGAADSRGGLLSFFQRKRRSSSSAPAADAPSAVTVSLSADSSLPAIMLQVGTADRTWEFLVPSSEAAIAAELVMLLRMFGRSRMEAWRHRLLLSPGAGGASGAQAPGLAAVVASIVASSAGTFGVVSLGGSAGAVGANADLSLLLGQLSAQPATQPIQPSAADDDVTGSRDRDDSPLQRAAVATASTVATAGGVNASAFDDAHTTVQTFGIPVQRITLDNTQQWQAVALAIFGDCVALQEQGSVPVSLFSPRAR